MRRNVAGRKTELALSSLLIDEPRVSLLWMLDFANGPLVLLACVAARLSPPALSEKLFSPCCLDDEFTVVQQLYYDMASSPFVFLVPKQR